MSQVVMLLLTLALGIYGVYAFKRIRPTLTKENFTKTMETWGWLALMLIAVIAFCVMMLR